MDIGDIFQYFANGNLDFQFFYFYVIQSTG